MPLRGARQGELALDVEVPTGVREGPRLSPGRPGVPQFAGRGDELGGARVPVRPVEVAAAAEVLAGEGVGGGDDVPGGAAPAEVVQRGEPASGLVGLVERRVDGRGEAEALGDGREGVQDGEGLRPPDDVEVVDAPLVLAQPQPFREEEEVEQAALGGSGKVLERREVDLGARERIGPDGGVVDPREVGGQMDLFAERPVAAGLASSGSCGHEGSPASAAYWLAGRASPRCSLKVLPG